LNKIREQEGGTGSAQKGGVVGGPNNIYTSKYKNDKIKNNNKPRYLSHSFSTSYG
jgi:hypothetical protein